MRKIIFTQEQIQNICDLYTKYNLSKENISKLFNVSKGVIARLLKESNIPSKSSNDCHRKFIIKEHFFDEINTEEKAYFLGFLYADGYNNLKKHTIDLRIKDEEILIKLNKLISNDNLVWKYQNKEGNTIYVLSICSKHMSKKLNELGCGENKTFECMFPNIDNVPNNLLHHFMRGCFDGDGTITHCKINRKNNKFSHAVSFAIIGNINFINGYLDILYRKCGINRAKLMQQHKNMNNRDKRIVSFSYSGRNQIIKIYNFLYKDATIFMQRKFDKFNYIRNKEDLIKGEQND